MASLENDAPTIISPSKPKHRPAAVPESTDVVHESVRKITCLGSGFVGGMHRRHAAHALLIAMASRSDIRGDCLQI